MKAEGICLIRLQTRQARPNLWRADIQRLCLSFFFVFFFFCTAGHGSLFVGCILPLTFFNCCFFLMQFLLSNITLEFFNFFFNSLISPLKFFVYFLFSNIALEVRKKYFLFIYYSLISPLTFCCCCLLLVYFLLFSVF